MKFDQKKFIEDLTKADDDGLVEILAKAPQDLTQEEIKRIMMRRLRLPAGSEKAALFALEKAFFDDKFGNEQVDIDDAGRLIQPKERAPVNDNPVPARARDGGDFASALARLARQAAKVAQREGAAETVKALQRGLNLMNHSVTREEGMRALANTPFGRYGSATDNEPQQPLFLDILDDGIAGPKTRAALRTAIARLGKGKAEEALAMGRFDRFLQDAHAGRPVEDLDRTARRCFGGLFRDPGKIHAGDRTEEGESLQMAVNDLGAGLLGKGAFNTIMEDGRIGPKTQDAFRRVLAAAGHDRMTEALARNLGFFMVPR